MVSTHARVDLPPHAFFKMRCASRGEMAWWHYAGGSSSGVCYRRQRQAVGKERKKAPHHARHFSRIARFHISCSHPNSRYDPACLCESSSVASHNFFATECCGLFVLWSWAVRWHLPSHAWLSAQATQHKQLSQRRITTLSSTSVVRRDECDCLVVHLFCEKRIPINQR